MLSLQQCNFVQRNDTSSWLLLSEAYASLSNSTVKDTEQCKDCAIYSNTDDDSTRSILSNTVTLFRPYFKWTTEVKCTSSRQELLEAVWKLLGRQVSVETFLQDIHRLPWEHHHEILKLIFQVSSCCCLIWARYDNILCSFE